MKFLSGSPCLSVAGADRRRTTRIFSWGRVLLSIKERTTGKIRGKRRKKMEKEERERGSRKHPGGKRIGRGSWRWSDGIIGTERKTEEIKSCFFLIIIYWTQHVNNVLLPMWVFCVRYYGGFNTLLRQLNILQVIFEFVRTPRRCRC